MWWTCCLNVGLLIWASGLVGGDAADAALHCQTFDVPRALTPKKHTIKRTIARTHVKGWFQKVIVSESKPHF